VLTLLKCEILQKDHFFKVQYPVVFAHLFCQEGTDTFKFSFRDFCQYMDQQPATSLEGRTYKYWLIEVYLRCVKETVSIIKSLLKNDRNNSYAKEEKLRTFFGMYSREVTLAVTHSIITSQADYSEANQLAVCKQWAWNVLAKLAKDLMIDGKHIIALVPLAGQEVEQQAGLAASLSSAFAIKFLSCSLYTVRMSLQDKLHMVSIILGKVHETNSMEADAKVVTSIIEFLNDAVVHFQRALVEANSMKLQIDSDDEEAPTDTGKLNADELTSVRASVCQIYDIARNLLQSPDLSLRNKETCSNILLNFVVGSMRGAGYDSVHQSYCLQD